MTGCTLCDRMVEEDLTFDQLLAKYGPDPVLTIVVAFGHSSGIVCNACEERITQ